MITSLGAQFRYWSVISKHDQLFLSDQCCIKWWCLEVTEVFVLVDSGQWKAIMKSKNKTIINASSDFNIIIVYSESIELFK